MNENTGFSNKGMKNCLDPTVVTYGFKAEGNVAVFIYEILKVQQNVCFGHWEYFSITREYIFAGQNRERQLECREYFWYVGEKW